jgi:predicted nucleotidyltransferase
MPAHIPIDQQAIAAFCRKWHVTELGLFGSVLRDDFRPDSDVDVFVTFADGHTPGWEIVTMQDELAALFGRQVDLGTKRSLSPRLAPRILASSEVIFAA